MPGKWLVMLIWYYDRYAYNHTWNDEDVWPVDELNEPWLNRKYEEDGMNILN